MSSTAKTILIVLIVLIAIGGLYFYWQNHQSLSLSPGTATQNQNSPATLPSGNNTSDAALQQDTAAIDTQLGGLTSDSATVDQSLNDKPISQ